MQLEHTKTGFKIGLIEVKVLELQKTGKVRLYIETEKEHCYLSVTPQGTTIYSRDPKAWPPYQVNK